MAVTVRELREWLADKTGLLVAVDKGGLTLVLFPGDATNDDLILAHEGLACPTFEVGGVPEPQPTVDPSEWDAPQCLRWLAAHVPGPHHYMDRADTWDGEVARFAAHEGVSEEDWNDDATKELRAAVERVSAGLPVE